MFKEAFNTDKTRLEKRHAKYDKPVNFLILVEDNVHYLQVLKPLQSVIICWVGTGPGFVSIPDIVISIKLAKRGQLNSSQNRDSDNEPGTAHLPMVNFVIFCFKFPCPQHNCLDFDCLQIPAMNQLHPPMVPSSLLCFSFNLYLACRVETSNNLAMLFQ